MQYDLVDHLSRRITLTLDGKGKVQSLLVEGRNVPFWQTSAKPTPDGRTALIALAEQLDWPPPAKQWLVIHGASDTPILPWAEMPDDLRNRWEA